MSVEIRIRVPKRLYDILEKRAKEQQVSLQDLIIVALAKIVREGGRRGG